MTGDPTAVAPVRSVQAARTATRDAVSGLRRLLRTWIREDGLHPDLAEDVVLAVDEAVTNVVEHAYPGQCGEVRLRLARSAPGELEVTVEDDGTWRPPPEDPGFRGRGVQLIHGLADRARITHSPRGTTVSMCWDAS
ncbi:ATP-binding protein [Actinomycetospora atypica]|uniref:ATP-binding protein n=1 Tax=Actinomycetospora atypica TaxID=1290095 RepID=A0ABV9YJF9_9PSEU